jgi:hypothetical protein
MKSRNIFTDADIENFKALQENKHLSDKEIPKNADEFLDRLMKYVPLEIIGAYLICEGIIKSTVTNGLIFTLLGLFILGIVGTFFYVKYYLNVKRSIQIYMSMLGFIIWVFSIGGWFGELKFYVAVYGTIGVVIFAVMVKIIKLPPLPDPETLLDQDNSIIETKNLELKTSHK